MPTPTEKNTQQIEELTRYQNELARRVDKVEGEATWSSEWVEKLRATDAEFEARIRLLEHTSAEDHKTREEWGKRGWNIVQLVIAAVVGSALTILARRLGGP